MESKLDCILRNVFFVGLALLGFTLGVAAQYELGWQGHAAAMHDERKY